MQEPCLRRCGNSLRQRWKCRRQPRPAARERSQTTHPGEYERADPGGLEEAPRFVEPVLKQGKVLRGGRRRDTAGLRPEKADAPRIVCCEAAGTLQIQVSSMRLQGAA